MTSRFEAVEGNDGERLVRFDLTERVLHWTNAVVTGVLLVTAAVLYIGPLSAVVGRRDLVRDVHVVAGLALPLPYVLALAGRWGAGLRGDIRRVNRWDDHDRRWLRSRGRDPGVRLGKFNAGQKLNAAFTAGAVLPMLATGAVMRWFDPFPLAWRTGATFVHDWLAIAITVAVIGHIVVATGDGVALGAMLRGWVPASWARRHRPRWYDEVGSGRPRAMSGDAAYDGAPPSREPSAAGPG
ncbi:MAG TPA: cytochrome b/b6 domain-containing protein [Acidimicrobiales bacterium]|nr:cytochrome b/b6 domain-containing protein [Acidimicrobiales bacterium]